ncbi:hypothetical protein GCM10009655_02440 [Rhodoglobus aureus]|uniref:Uncharacterized protein n=1 Tax=Rhodoglobus aureus TaxID=191497 RepID=A0ABP4FYL2_9MICO
MSALVDLPQSMTKSSPHTELDWSESVKGCRSQSRVEIVKLHDILKACAYKERILSSTVAQLSEGIPISAEAVIVDALQVLDRLSARSHIHASGNKKIKLRIIRLENLHTGWQQNPRPEK